MSSQEYIKELAKKKGYSLRRLAAEAGINYQSLYSALARDNDYLSEDMLDRISTVLGISKESIKGSPDTTMLTSKAMSRLLGTIYGIVGTGMSEKDESRRIYMINAFLERYSDMLKEHCELLEEKENS